MNIEVMAEIPFHLKLECTDKMESPIIMNVGDIKTGVLKDLEIYCSFSNKEPSRDKCDFEASNQEEIKIFEPHNRKAFVALGEIVQAPEQGEDEPTIIKQHQTLYICIISKK